jgi:hypothetical protein
MKKAMDNSVILQRKVVSMPYADRQGGVKDHACNICWIYQKLVD